MHVHVMVHPTHPMMRRLHVMHASVMGRLHMVILMMMPTTFHVVVFVTMRMLMAVFVTVVIVFLVPHMLVLCMLVLCMLVCSYAARTCVPYACSAFACKIFRERNFHSVVSTTERRQGCRKPNYAFR